MIGLFPRYRIPYCDYDIIFYYKEYGKNNVKFSRILYYDRNEDEYLFCYAASKFQELLKL